MKLKPTCLCSTVCVASTLFRPSLELQLARPFAVYQSSMALKLVPSLDETGNGIRMHNWQRARILVTVGPYNSCTFVLLQHRYIRNHVRTMTPYTYIREHSIRLCGACSGSNNVHFCTVCVGLAQ